MFLEEHNFLYYFSKKKFSYKVNKPYCLDHHESCIHVSNTSKHVKYLEINMRNI